MKRWILWFWAAVIITLFLVNMWMNKITALFKG